MERVSRVLFSTLYDGTPASAAAVLTMCQQITQYSGNAWSIDSDDGQTLRLKETNPGGLRADWPVQKGQYVVVAPDTGIIARMASAVYPARYASLAEIFAQGVESTADAIAASAPVQAAITTAVGKAMYGGFGVATLPALLLGATSQPITVTIKPTQPDTGYAVEAFAITGSAVLAALEVVSVAKASKSSVTVVVKNAGLVTLSGVLLLHITAPMKAS